MSVTVKAHTTVPVPDVLAWSSLETNPVGAEFIVMNPAPGVQLFKVWDSMDFTKMTLIDGLTKSEHQLAMLYFPSHGSLYLTHSLKAKTKQTPLHLDDDDDDDVLSDSYCIGPSCDRSWLCNLDVRDTQADFDPGPCKNPSVEWRKMASLLITCRAIAHCIRRDACQAGDSSLFGCPRHGHQCGKSRHG